MNSVSLLLGQGDEVTGRAVGELKCTNQTLRIGNIRDIGDIVLRGGCPWPLTWYGFSVLHQDSCCQLRAGVPGSVLNFIISFRNRDSLFCIYILYSAQILCDKSTLLLVTYKDAIIPMWLLKFLIGTFFMSIIENYQQERRKNSVGSRAHKWLTQ